MRNLLSLISICNPQSEIRILVTLLFWIVAPSFIGGGFIPKDNNGPNFVPQSLIYWKGVRLKRMGVNNYLRLKWSYFIF
jgi:hypothetical protein